MATHNNKQVQFWCILAFASLLAMNTDAAPGERGKGDFVLWQELTPLTHSDAQWGDFDNDGDLDLVIAGLPEGSDDAVTYTYENQAGTLVYRQELVGTSTHHSNGHLGWGDYDGDGDLDLALAGDTVRNANPVARIYENNGNGNLTWDTEQDLVALGDASVAWGDYDNDGDLDLVIIGSVSPKVPGTPILYRNDPLGTLTPDPEISLAAMCGGSADWGDHDNDGDLDLLFLGFAGPTTPKTVIHENDPVGTLTNIGGLGLPQLARGDAEWGDYDNDGDLDLAITGDGGGWTCARVYRNNDGAGFTKVFDGFSANYSSCAWGDYDNDGDLDVGFCGGIDAGRHSMIYENTGGSFVHAFELQPMRRGSTTWADVDQDGDLDFFLTGNEDGVSYYARLYENIGHPPNTPPSPPTESHQEWTADGLLLSWSGASDAETPTAGLYYCLRVGTSPGAHDIMSGTYGTPLMGNVG